MKNLKNSFYQLHRPSDSNFFPPHFIERGIP